MSIELLAYRTYWEDGEIDLKDHDDFKWISLEQLAEFDFAPADLVFVENSKKEKLPFSHSLKDADIVNKLIN
jgi:8-oxo-dGTP diphosphatase